MKDNDKLEFCPCCGYDTFDRTERFEYSICPICYWEDDTLQFADPELSGGANKVSLIQAQLNFEKFGACEEEMIRNVRKPTNKDNRNPNHKIYQKIWRANH